MKDILLYEKVPLLENNFTVKFMKFSDSFYLAPHWHEHMELLYFLSGECMFTCNGKNFSVSANDFVVVNSTEIHSFIASENVSYFAILIYPPFFQDVIFNDKIVLENLIHNDKYIEETIIGMYKEYTTNTECSDMILKGNAYQLIAYLIRNFTESHLSAKDSTSHSSKLNRINILLEYISNHYHEKITVSQLAKLCFISEEHLCRFFKNNIGKSITEYINEFRIEKAAVMLSNTDENITNIAFEVGFDDLNYFSRIFKKIKSKSPSEYRKNCHNTITP